MTDEIIVCPLCDESFGVVTYNGQMSEAQADEYVGFLYATLVPHLREKHANTSVAEALAAVSARLK